MMNETKNKLENKYLEYKEHLDKEFERKKQESQLKTNVFSQISESRMKNLDMKLIYLLNYALATYSRDFSILEGERTIARQQTLYQQGRTIPGAVVTNCDGVIKKSKHQVDEYGKVKAVDLLPYPFKGWKDTESFEHLSKHIKRCADKFKIKIAWGGDWKMIDLPHFELQE